MGNSSGRQLRAFCSVAMPTLPSTILKAARMSSSASASWMDFMSRLRICVGVCLAPWAEGGGELESSHSFSHSPSQAWRIRRVMAVEMDSPLWPLFPPRVLMLENNNRSKKKNVFYVTLFLSGSFVPGGAARDMLSQLV